VRTPSQTRQRRHSFPAAIPAALFLVALLPFVALAERVGQLKPQGYVNDFAGVLSDQAKSQLTALCEEVDHRAGAQIAIVTVHSLEGQPASDFAVDLAEHWGVGPKQKDRGVLILLAPNDHKYWVTVGYGLEPILPDGKVGGFGREMIPLLRQNDYDGALLLITGRIAEVIAQDRGVTLTAARDIPTAPAERERAPNILSVLVILFFLAFPMFGFILRLLLGFGGRGRYRRGGWGMIGGPWIGGGGSSWGGGGFGGGFGGFGGGGFGGGGAGGSW
jgi:uncharacterized protein